jgi:hypothetical protein
MNHWDENENTYNTLWKTGTLFVQLSDTYVKLRNPSEHLAVDEVNVIFKGRFNFKQYWVSQKNVYTL